MDHSFISLGTITQTFIPNICSINVFTFINSDGNSYYTITINKKGRNPSISNRKKFTLSGKDLEFITAVGNPDYNDVYTLKHT